MKIKSNHILSMLWTLGVIPLFIQIDAVTVVVAIISMIVSREIWGFNLFD